MGVYWNDRWAKWKIEFKIGGRLRYFGAFVTKEEALARQERVRPKVERMREQYWKKKRAERAKKPAPKRKTGYRSPKNPWPLSDYAYLREHIHEPVPQLAQALGRTPNSIRAAKLRIRRGEVI